MTDFNFEKMGYCILVFLTIVSVLEGSIILTLVNLLFGWTIPFAGIIIDMIDKEHWW